MGKCCFFIGHRDTPPTIRPSLVNAVEQHIVAYGVARFIVGHYGDFDRMVANVLSEAKTRHRQIKVYLLTPYHPAERPVAVPHGFDGLYYPFEERVPPRLAIVRANQKMIDKCDFLIAYTVHPGNARNLVDYARKKEKQGIIQVENLADLVLL